MADEYYSCEWIEGGLAFNRRSLHACLIVHHGRGMPHYADYNGGPLPLAQILEGRAAIRAQHKSGEVNEACAGCAHLKLDSWPEPEQPFDILGIAHYSHCNIKCNYCFLQTQDPASFADGFRPYSLVETIEAMYEGDQLAEDAIIDWGGGEPSIYKQFDPIVQLSLEHGAYHYVHSNAVRFPEFVDGHERSNQIHIVCSVDAGRPETYLDMKARDRLEQVWKSLERYIRCGAEVTVKYIMKEENASALDTVPFVERLVEIGGTNLIIDIDYDYPEPSETVINGLVRLKVGALAAGILVRYGFTGDNFANEYGVSKLLQAAYNKEQLRCIEERLEAEGYAAGELSAASVTTLIDMLKSHTQAKDEHIEGLTTQLIEKEALINWMNAQLLGRSAEPEAQPVELRSRNGSKTATLAPEVMASLEELEEKEAQIRLLSNELDERLRHMLEKEHLIHQQHDILTRIVERRFFVAMQRVQRYRLVKWAASVTARRG